MTMTIEAAKKALGFSKEKKVVVKQVDGWGAAISPQAALKKIPGAAAMPFNKAFAVLQCDGHTAAILEAKAKILTNPTCITQPFAAVLVTTTNRQAATSSLRQHGFKFLGSRLNPTTGNTISTWIYLR